VSDNFRDYPHPPGPRQQREHAEMLERKRQETAERLGITVEELDRRIEAGEPVDQ
jgi:hypothetical protein